MTAISRDDHLLVSISQHSAKKTVENSLKMLPNELISLVQEYAFTIFDSLPLGAAIGSEIQAAPFAHVTGMANGTVFSYENGQIHTLDLFSIPGVVQKSDFMARSLPEFEPSEAGAEAAQLNPVGRCRRVQRQGKGDEARNPFLNHERYKGKKQFSFKVNDFIAKSYLTQNGLLFSVGHLLRGTYKLVVECNDMNEQSSQVEIFEHDLCHDFLNPLITTNQNGDLLVATRAYLDRQFYPHRQAVNALIFLHKSLDPFFRFNSENLSGCLFITAVPNTFRAVSVHNEAICLWNTQDGEKVSSVGPQGQKASFQIATASTTILATIVAETENSLQLFSLSTLQPLLCVNMFGRQKSMPLGTRLIGVFDISIRSDGSLCVIEDYFGTKPNYLSVLSYDTHENSVSLQAKFTFEKSIHAHVFADNALFTLAADGLLQRYSSKRIWMLGVNAKK